MSALPPIATAVSPNVFSAPQWRERLGAVQVDHQFIMCRPSGRPCALEDAIDIQAVACGGPRYIIASSATAKSTMAMPIAAFARVADMTVA